MRELILYSEYSRQEVHAIFAPDSPFTPQAGTWGLQGIIEVPERPGDHVFFVTFGQKQAAHEFDEGITSDGVLRWQSQPKQRLVDGTIQNLIAHDEDQNSIYLFLRTTNKRGVSPRPYTYLGRLKYLIHDHDRERPVYFTWQILDWHLPEDVRKEMELRYEGASISHQAQRDGIPAQRGLILVDAPKSSRRTGVGTAAYIKPPKRDYAEQDARNRQLGLAGEEAVLESERRSLVAAAKPELVERLLHVAKVEGDAAGYDIKSYTIEGVEKFIEVKTTTGHERTAFYASASEVRFATEHADHYYLYRVFEFDQKTCSGKVFVQKGILAENFSLEPVQFKVELTPRS